MCPGDCIPHDGGVEPYRCCMNLGTSSKGWNHIEDLCDVGIEQDKRCWVNRVEDSQSVVEPASR